MKAFWDAYAALYSWQTGIPIAFNAALAIAVIVYTTSTHKRLRRSIICGSCGFVLAYVLLMGSEFIDLRAWILALIIGIIIGIIIMTILRNYEDENQRILASISLGLVSFFILGLSFMGISRIGNFFLLSIPYTLYIAALIGLPTLSIIAAIFIFSKLKHPGLSMTVFCYLTISAYAASMYFLSFARDITQKLNPNTIEIVNQIRSFFRYMSAYLSPILFLIGPFLLMIVIFHFRQTIGTWVGSICGIITITSIQIIMVRYPLYDILRNVFRASSLTWILIIYTVSTVSLGAYYLWTLYRQRVEKKVENLHPLLAIGAIVLNVCFLYPVVVSSELLLWGAWFAGINLLIGLVILFGRRRLLSP